MAPYSQSLAKLPTGIEGFDRLSDGGIPLGRTTLLIGGPGAGKTVFAMQTLVNNLRDRQTPGIFVAFEETPRNIVANISAFGWVNEIEDENRLFILDGGLSPSTIAAGNFDLTGLLAMLQAKVDAMKAGCLVLDGIDVLLTLLQDPHKELREIYRVRDWLAGVNLTCIITAKLDADLQSLAHYNSMQFMADCAIRLEQSLESGLAVRRLQITKYRGSDFIGGQHVTRIGPTGMEVLAPGPTLIAYHASTERISAGFKRLDLLLGGGVYRGNSTLITGAPGTAKTTLAAKFIEVACQRGERALFVSFDEGSEPILRNLLSTGIDLQPHIDSGLLRMHPARIEGDSPEGHFHRLAKLINEHRPDCMVIDPLSALIQAGALGSARNVAARLVYLLKDRMISTLITALVDSDNPETEATELKISTVADTWIHLAYLVHGGERNRTLSVVKSRGTPHSNQVRELILTGNGPTLADVYVEGGEVLIGTLRWEKENQSRLEARQRQAEYQYQHAALESATAETRSRIAALQHELERQQAELQLLSVTHDTRLESSIESENHLRTLRNADPNLSAPPPKGINGRG